MIKKIAIGVGALMVALLGFITTRPDDFKVVRSSTVHGTPEAVYAMINDFHQWREWSPWDKMDPSQKTSYSGPASGVGAHYAWEGNKDVGKGEMTIEKATPNQSVEITLHFIEPFEATNVTRFTLSPAPGGTNVEWAMTGTNQFIGKAMSLFMNMDSMIGKDFEEGLKNMDRVALARAAAPTPPPSVP
jgi:uncharacterized protein YndB with AHSA1/START domain